MHYVRTGPRGGDPVILLHPVGLDLTYWGAQVEALCDDHDVIACDLPGHGRTPGSPEDWTLDNAASFIPMLLESVGAEGAHVVGLSVGGMIAQATAIMRPDVVRSLVLIDTAASFTDDARDGMRKRALAARDEGMAAVLQSTIERWFTSNTISRRPDLVDRVERTLLADDPRIHGALWDMIRRIDLVSQLHRIACRTLILVGEHDPSSPVTAACELHEHIVDSGLHIIEDAAHLAPLEQPLAVNTYLRTFLKG